MTTSQTFTLPGATSIVLPGAYLSAAGRAVLATGVIKRLIVNPDTNGVLVIGVYDAYDTNGDTFRSTGRVKREIDVTGAAAMRQSVFEIVGTAITGGPSLSTYNKKAEFTIPPETYDLGTGTEYVGPPVEIDCDILCWHGMIVQVTGFSAGSSLSVVYEARVLGKHYLQRAQHQIQAF